LSDRDDAQPPSAPLLARQNSRAVPAVPV